MSLSIVMMATKKANLVLSSIDTEDTSVGGSASSQFQIRRDGTVWIKNSGSLQQSSDTKEWIDRKGDVVGDQFEVIFNRTSGDVPTGTMESYVSITSNITWTLTQTGVGSKTTNGNITIRRISNPSQSITVAVSMTSETSEVT